MEAAAHTKIPDPAAKQEKHTFCEIRRKPKAATGSESPRLQSAPDKQEQVTKIPEPLMPTFASSSGDGQ